MKKIYSTFIAMAILIGCGSTNTNNKSQYWNLEQSKAHIADCVIETKTNQGKCAVRKNYDNSISEMIFDNNGNLVEHREYYADGGLLFFMGDGEDFRFYYYDGTLAVQYNRELQEFQCVNGKIIQDNFKQIAKAHDKSDDIRYIDKILHHLCKDHSQ